ncbi:MAG: L-threonylcarbamoyladenylate synthase [Acidimicrobiales bacterium]
MTPGMDVQIAEAVIALRSGQVVAIPTDTVYGLAADPGVEGATAEMFRLKGRPSSTALPVLVESAEQAAGLARLDEHHVKLLAAYWPGPLTVVVPRRATAMSWALGGDGSTIGLRCPGNELARNLLHLSGPLAVSSANRHGRPPCRTAVEARSELGDGLVVLDGGTCEGQSSTVVSLLGGSLRLLRAGPLSLEDLESVL